MHTLLCLSVVQCDYFVSEHDEDIVQLLQEDLTQEELEYELCTDIAGENEPIMTLCNT